MRALVVVVAALLLCSKADAVSCSFSATTGVAFGGYDVFAASPLATTGTLTWRCTGVGGSDTVVIELGAGASGSTMARAMGATTPLAYNLYLDAAHTQVWGNGTGGSARFGPVTPPEDTDVTVTIFGLIPAQQTSVAAGIYADTVVATILF